MDPDVVDEFALMAKHQMRSLMAFGTVGGLEAAGLGMRRRPSQKDMRSSSQRSLGGMAGRLGSGHGSFSLGSSSRRGQAAGRGRLAFPRSSSLDPEYRSKQDKEEAAAAAAAVGALEGAGAGARSFQMPRPLTGGEQRQKGPGASSSFTSGVPVGVRAGSRTGSHDSANVHSASQSSSHGEDTPDAATPSRSGGKESGKDRNHNEGGTEVDHEYPSGRESESGRSGSRSRPARSADSRGSSVSTEN